MNKKVTANITKILKSNFQRCFIVSAIANTLALRIKYNYHIT